MRRGGVLCHLTSLPSGKLGPDAFTFIDLLSEAGISVWQMLPISPPDEHGSPYASPSAFAGSIELCDPSFEEGPDQEFITGFLEENGHWAWDWALFDALKEENNGAPWIEWPDDIRTRDTTALAAAAKRLHGEVQKRIELQARFERDWLILRHYADSRGVQLYGDMPIFVAHDSADVWARPHLFQLNQDGTPAVVAGVPPDYFSEDGQRWGTVLYNWDAHAMEMFTWWRLRISRMRSLFDFVRIDHFRGIDSAWAIPANDDHARNGEWQAGPGDAFVKTILTVTEPHSLFAEDLGIIPDSVKMLRKRHGLAGMAVLHFAFDDENPNNPHRPENIQEDQIVYSGTHDNDTTVGWWKNSPAERRTRVLEHLEKGEKPHDTLIRLAMNSPARLAVIPLQDVFGIEGRMNTPGTPHGNWQWKFEWDQFDVSAWEALKKCVAMSGRAHEE